MSDSQGAVLISGATGFVGAGEDVLSLPPKAQVQVAAAAGPAIPGWRQPASRLPDSALMPKLMIRVGWILMIAPSMPAGDELP